MTPSRADRPINRWAQLALMVACTVMLSNMQYGWTLFVNPMQRENHWERAGIQLAFSIMILLNTWLAPVEGLLVDRHGPRPVVMFGGLCAAAAWIMNSYAQSLGSLYAGAIVGGIGVGCVFGTCMGTALKWFPDRRGLGGGADRDGLRPGRGGIGDPARGHDSSQRLSPRISRLRIDSRAVDFRHGCVSAEAGGAETPRSCARRAGRWISILPRHSAPECSG